MAKYFVKNSTGKLIQHNTNKPTINGITRKKRRNYINVQIPKQVNKIASTRTASRNNGIKNKKVIETLQIPSKGKKMLEQMSKIRLEKEKQHAEIKSAIAGYNKIIESIQERIKSNNKEIEEFNKVIEQNLKEIDLLKDVEQGIITSFKNKMESTKQLHNESLIKDNVKCNTLISETELNIKKLEKELDKISKLGSTKFGTTF